MILAMKIFTYGTLAIGVVAWVWMWIDAVIIGPRDGVG